LAFRPITGAINRMSVIIWMAASVVAVIAGPFDTYANMGLGTRTAYWTSLIGLSIVMAHAIRTSVKHYWPDLNRNVSGGLINLVFSVLFSGIVERTNHLILDAEANAGMNHIEVFIFVLAITSMLSVIRRFVQDGLWQARQASDETVAASATERPRLFDRLTVVEGARVVRMTVDDHYVILHLSDGSEQRLLMRFADAVAEMAGQPGLLTHRSHWVSLDMVAGVSRESGREVVVLKTGEHVPLSRTYRGAFEERGFAAPAPSRLAMTTE